MACLEGSAFLKPFLLMATGLREKLGSRLRQPANFLQFLSFILSVVMLAILALPQFASDKEGLALITLGNLFLYMLGYLLGGEKKRNPTYIDAIVISLLAANLIATFASHYFMESLKGLAKLLVYILSYFLFTAVINKSKNRALTLYGGACLGACLVSLYGLYQYKIGVAPLATWEDPSVENKGTRIYSTLGNPNLLAGYLLPLIPISFGLAFITLQEKLKLALKLPLFAFTLLVALTITMATMLTGCRGAFIACGLMLFAALGAALALVVVKKPKLIAPSLLVLFLLILLTAGAIHFLAPNVESRLLSVFAGAEHSSNAYRMNVWRACLKMLKDNWWFGVGPGNTTFRLAYGLYMKSGFDALGTYCVPLEVMVEAGLLGILSFAGLIIGLLTQGHILFWQSGLKTANISLRLLALTSSLALLGLMAHGLVDTVFYRPQVHFVFWLICAVLASLKAED
jgi:putative inorganic carbon (HCO3(-)) transporter